MAPPGTAHGLGPHVVGRRVVVRRVLRGETGPSGGPAMTDVLGTLLSWGPDSCVVAPEGGAPVTVALADVVTGKPVPPRGSVRQRVSPRDAELRALPLWTSPTVEHLGEWTLRVVEGERGRGSRRANSCLALGDPGRPLAEAVAAVRTFYESRGREVLVQAQAGSPVEAALLAEGWGVGEPSDAPFLVGSVAMALRTAGAPGEAVADTTLPRLRAGVTVDGEEVARGRAELNGDWLGVHGLSVEDSHRRRGFGRSVMAALLEAGAEAGASTVWLEVARDNTAAWMLYAGLGLREHHLCRFLVAP